MHVGDRLSDSEIRGKCPAYKMCAWVKNISKIYLYAKKEGERMPVPSRWRIKKALHEFIRELQKTEGDNLIMVTVFGSVARGEEKEDSDIDVFVLLKEEGKGNPRHRVAKVAFGINAQKIGSGIYISPFVCTKDQYAKGRHKSLVFHYIDQEGAVLYDAEG